ncbi:MAG: HTTM domain-containing protein [Pirellulales bacterium]
MDLVTPTRDWLRGIVDSWNRFWFTPAPPHTLALIRVLGGGMLFYTHLVWGLDLEAFLGPHPWLTRDAVSLVTGSEYGWSYLWYLDSPPLLYLAHAVALLVFLLLTIGCATRVVSVLAWIITLAYCHRLQGALYGLDQVNAMLAMYLMVGPSGDAYSVDAWWRRRRAARAGLGGDLVPPARLGTNLAIRLMQVHLSIVYLFGGISKLKGSMWWDGSAVWFAFANYEYQSLDMTWMAAWPWAIALLTHTTVFWETFYPVLVWPRATRPIMIFLAVCVHGGIALCLGMKTFGLAMIIANMAFLPPSLVDGLVSSVSRPAAPATRPMARRAA